MRADAQRNRGRVLDAAEQVFAEFGPSATTEEVARRAGVAIGTVFRHFPTKKDLLTAIVKRLVDRLVAQAGALTEHDDGTGLFAFFARMVEESAATGTVVQALGIDLPQAVERFGGTVGALLRGAQAHGRVRPDVRPEEVMALLVSVCQGALHGGWSPALQQRTLAVVYSGLAPRPTARENPGQADDQTSAQVRYGAP